jgi:hypothetical protein
VQSTRRWFVIPLAVALLMGAAWYRRHSTSPAETPSIPGHPRVAARPVAGGGDRAVPGRNGTNGGGRETVVCGLGTVRLEGNDRAAPFNYVDRVTGAAQSRWRRTLINGDDYHERAAGLLLRSTGWDYDSISGMPTRTHDAVLARDELVQLAAGLDDLPVYAMAVRACDQSYDPAPRDAACDRISLAKWAAMDPDNAAPWLEIAAAAHARSDQAAEFEAVSQAAHAHRIDFGNDSLLAYANSAMPQETTSLERAAFLHSLIGYVGGDGQAHSFATSRYCTAEAVQQDSIRQQCEALADLLADQGRNTLDLSAAAAIGAHVGWASERITATQQEMLAMFRVETPSDKDPWSCDNVRAVNEFAELQARSGELAAARDAIQKSGKSIPQLAQEQIDSLRRAAEEECSRSGGTLTVFPGGVMTMCAHRTNSNGSGARGGP